MLLAALLLNLFWSRRLKKAWNISAMAVIAVFLTCGLLILIGINSGTLAVSLNLAARAIAESVTAVTLVHSLTAKSGQ
jgi:4-amino-4-deoxy-L-arabinose transferase-like glycosyltransferase